MTSATPREIAELVASLVAIDSVNPSLVEGGAGEAEMARFVASWCERAGLEVAVEQTAPGRPTVLALRRGRGGGPSLLLNAHTDTVGVAGMDDAHEPRIDGERLVGRGAYDMKGGLAAAMLALATAPQLAGDVVLAAVPDEEAGGLGTRALLERHPGRFDAAIIPEPTNLDVGVAHKGFVGFEIETIGRAAHGSLPEEGVDAIAAMAAVLEALTALDQQLRGATPHPLLGASSIHASTIHGGTEFSSYPARCVLQGEWRTLPGESPDAALEGLRAAATVPAELRVVFRGEPFEAPTGAAIVGLIEQRAGTSRMGMPFWADSALLASGGVPTALFGPRGGGAHAADEWVDLRSVDEVRAVLVDVMRGYCVS